LQQFQVEERRTDPEFQVPPNVLEPCGEEIRLAMQRLFNAEGRRAYTVVQVVRNVNPVLRTRYDRAKAQLGGDTRIKQHAAKTAQHVINDPAYSCLGTYDASVNEYPLWHGTPSAEGVGGICKTGFDMAYAGATGSAYSPGFYFADESTISDGYARQGFYVNSKFNNMRALLLCRVVCGNLREVSKAPSEREKETLTAECLGPGGTFGAKSSFHSVLGGGWAYVCMHRDQVYPEYVAIYQHGAPPDA